MYSIVLVAAFSAAPADAGYLLPGRAARVEARHARQEARGCSGGQAASQGCSGGQAIQFVPAASCQGGQGGASFAFPPQSVPTTFYYVPATAPQAGRPLFFFRQQCRVQFRTRRGQRLPLQGQHD